MTLLAVKVSLAARILELLLEVLARVQTIASTYEAEKQPKADPDFK